MSTPGTGAGYEDLVRIIRHVRRRWRLRMALKGAAAVAGVGLFALAVSAYGIDHFRYSPLSVALFRVFTYLALAGLTVRFLALPFFRRVKDDQVALYVEEHDRSLQESVLSAVELGPGADEEQRTDLSPALLQRLIQSAIDRCVDLDYGEKIEHQNLRKASGMLAAVAAVGMMAAMFSPTFLRHGASLLFNPWGSARAANPYLIQVEPGDIAVARGADQIVIARLQGFDSDRVELAARSGDVEKWQRWRMTLDEETGDFAFMLFDLSDSTSYFVEASGVRSDVHRIEVADLPYVKKIDLELHFPEYTGLSPRTIEDGGDIAVLRGTRVKIQATPTVQVGGGSIVVEGQESLPLEIESDGRLSGTIEVESDGFYKIELQSFEGTMRTASPDYSIEVLTDQPPSVTITKPGRDTKVTPIEEVFTELKAEDDYGLGRLELVYSVNGGPEEKTELYRSGSSSKTELFSSYTFFLEDLELEPGDFVSYFARATDANRVDGPQTATTDIYFIEARPFDKRYRQAQQLGGGGDAGMDGTLSIRQRQIVAATFKLIRDKRSYSAKDYAENLTTVALMQGRLREQVENLLRRMGNRGIGRQDSEFSRIAESLRLAVEQMIPAEVQLVEKKPQQALSPEQRALQHLQRAEAVFRDVQVAFGGGGGPGGGGQTNAEDLADLFELELDKLRNQYETVQRGERQSVDNRVDEALQRLQELARRQQQENERARRKAGNLRSPSGGRGTGQRTLADEAEEIARKLERLAREQSLPDLMDTARRLKQAANAMRRAASQSGEGSLSDGIAALDKLKDARRLLEKNRAVRLERDLQDALERARRIASQEEKVLSDVRKLGEGGAGGSDPRERLQRLLDRKDELDRELADLESQMDRMARESRNEQKAASRKLEEAAKAIRESKLKERIRYSKGVVQARSPEFAERLEEQIQRDIGHLVDRIREASGAIGQSEEAKVAEALEKTRELVRNLDSFSERIRDRQDQARGLRRDGSSRRDGQSGQSERERQGQQGSESQGGEREGPGGGIPGSVNAPGFVGPGTDGGQGFQPGTFSAEEIRQLRREFQERVRDARDLRRQLSRRDLQVPDLESIIDRMREFDRKQIYLDPKGIDELQSSLLQELKQFEYWLRRELEGLGEEKLFLAGSDQVPSEYRKLVEEYYRTLSRQPRR